MRRRIVVRDPSVCHHCKRKGLGAADSFCPDCGFPQQGTEAEQRRFVVEKRRERSLQVDHEAMVRKARNFLLLAAGLNMITFLSKDPLTLLIGLIISGIFVGLSFWAKRRAYPAILTGLLTYISIQLLFGVIDIWLLVGGLLWKIAIVGALYYALRSAKELEERGLKAETRDGAGTTGPAA